MFTKSKIAAIALVSSLTVASSVQAEEVSLEKYVSSMVSQVMTVAQEELKNSVRENILNVAHNISLDENKSYVAKVTITDLATQTEEATKNNAE